MPFARDRYTGNGATTSYSATFPSISPAHVKVYVNGILQTSGYTLAGGSVTFSSAPAAGAAIEIVRDSSRGSRLTNFVDAVVLTASALNRDSQQALYVAQEALDASDAALSEDGTGQYSAESKRIKNLAAPVDAADAATKGYVDTQTAAIASTASNASFTALGAALVANTASEAATAAQTTANTAQTTANKALRTDDLVFDLPFGGPYNALNRRIVNLAAPTSAADAATKAYVDALVASGLPAPPPPPPPPPPPTLTDGAVTNLQPTSFTLGVTVGGTIPSGAQVRIEWTDNAATGPWRASATPLAVVGPFSHNFTGAPPGVSITWRAQVYTSSSFYDGFVFSFSETVHASLPNSTFTTPTEEVVVTPLALVNGEPASITATSFTLSATVSGDIPPGSVTMIQWTDAPLTGPWRESPRASTVAGVFSHAFTGAPAGTTITWRAFVFTDVTPAIIHAQTANETFNTSAGSQTAWVQLLQDSMTVQDVTERVASGSDFGHVISAGGVPIPFPDSYAGYTSQAGIVASLTGRPTGLGGEVSSWSGNPLVAPRPIDSPNILHFTRGNDAIASWGWFAAKQGHTSTIARLRVSDYFCAVFRESTRTWQPLYSGMRGWGARWYGRFNEVGPTGFGEGDQDLSTDPNATYVRPSGGFHYELWPARTPTSPPEYVDFYGRIDRALMADMRSWVIGCKVRVEGSDRADSRFVGNIGIDHYRSDQYGTRSWPSGYPAYVTDSGGGEWRNIRNDGLDQWIVAVGCFELGRFQGIRPPWGSWVGTWPYSAAPDFGPSWPEIVANPPPDLRA